MSNEASVWTFGYRGFVTVGGIVIPHLVRLELQTTYNVQDNIKRYNSAGTFSFPYDKIRKATMEWHGFSPLLMAALGAASVAAGGYKVHEREECEVATQAFTLANPPLPPYDYCLSLYYLEGGDPSRFLIPVAATPGTDEFTVDKETGEVTLGGTVPDETLIYADYLEDQAVDGHQIVLSDTFAASALDIMGVAGTIEMSDGTRGLGSMVLPKCIPLGEPPILFGTGESKSSDVELSIKGQPIIFVE